MSSASLAQRVFRTVGESPAAERVADAQTKVYGPLLEWVRHSPFHSDVLGHSPHPVLTDVTLGCWLSTSLLDLVGGSDSRCGATLLVGAGVAAAVPTALTGAADWAETSGTERSIGAVHSLGTDVATALFLSSLVARVRGKHGTGVKLALAGNLVMAGAGLLGAHLALTRGTARRTST